MDAMISPVPCSCRLHDPVDPGTDWDDGERKLITGVLEHGWHALMAPDLQALLAAGFTHSDLAVQQVAQLARDAADARDLYQDLVDDLKEEIEALGCDCECSGKKGDN